MSTTSCMHAASLIVRHVAHRALRRACATPNRHRCVVAVTATHDASAVGVRPGRVCCFMSVVQKLSHDAHSRALKTAHDEGAARRRRRRTGRVVAPVRVACGSRRVHARGARGAHGRTHARGRARQTARQVAVSVLVTTPMRATVRTTDHASMSCGGERHGGCG